MIYCSVTCPQTPSHASGDGTDSTELPSILEEGAAFLHGFSHHFSYLGLGFVVVLGSTVLFQFRVWELGLRGLRVLGVLKV